MLPGYEALRNMLQRRMGLDLNDYRGAQLERRLTAAVQRAGARDLAEYAALLERDDRIWQQFEQWFTIGVTEFFRNPEKFAELAGHILPELMRKGTVRIWSAGCSNGAEPYSVAILLHELDPAGDHKVLATDIDAAVLERAMQGLYPDKDLRHVEPQRRQRFFRCTDGLWSVTDAVRRKVEFRRHNLLADPYPTDIDLILCRNVVIYFTDEAKTSVYRRFARALKPGGILFVGGTESMLRARELGYEPVRPFFYRTAGPMREAIS